MKENLTRALGALPAHVRRLHHRPEGRRGRRHRGPAPRRLHGVPAGPRRRATRRCSATSSSEDASAVIEQLDAAGRPLRAQQRRQHDHGAAASRSTRPGSRSAARACPTQRARAATRCSTSRASPPRSSRSRPSFKRAMEGELANTIEAIDGVETAVVHLAMPPKQVFADEQDPTTASVLVDDPRRHHAGPRAGAGGRQPGRLQHRRPRPGQGHRRRLHRQGALRHRRLRRRLGQHPRPSRSRTSRTGSTARSRRCSTASSARATPPSRSPPNLDFDKTVTETTRYFGNADDRRCRETEASETSSGAGPGGTPAAWSAPTARWTPPRPPAAATRRTRRAAAPPTTPSTRSSSTARPPPAAWSRSTSASSSTPARSPAPTRPTSQDLVAAALGIDPERGDTIEVTPMPFDRTAEAAAAEELEASAAADEEGRRRPTLIRNGGLVAAGRAHGARRLAPGRKRRRRPAPRRRRYVVEQLRRDAARPAAAAAAPRSRRSRRRCWPWSAPRPTPPTRCATRSPRSSSGSPRTSPRCCAAGSWSVAA